MGERLLNAAIRLLERVPTPLLAAVFESLCSVAFAVDRRHRGSCLGSMLLLLALTI